MITQITETPFNYYPNNSSRNVFRIESSDDNGLIAWADLFVENNWAHFVYVYVTPEHRSEQEIFDFIKSAFLLDLGTTNIYWYNISSSVAHFFELIVAERPDMTFAAGGAINRICRATK